MRPVVRGNDCQVTRHSRESGNLLPLGVTNKKIPAFAGMTGDGFAGMMGDGFAGMMGDRFAGMTGDRSLRIIAGKEGVGT